MEPNHGANMSNIVRSYIEGIRPFYGESKDLLRFIKEVDDIIPTLATRDEIEVQIRFKQILSKIMGKARCVLYNTTETWGVVRSALIRTFADHVDIGTLFIRLEQITYQGSIMKTHDTIASHQIRLLEKIELSNDPPEEKRILVSSVKRRAFIQFRKCLPQACQGALTSRNCTTLSEAIQILQQEEFLNYDRYYEDRQFPSQQRNQFNRRTTHNHNHSRGNQNNYNQHANNNNQQVSRNYNQRGNYNTNRQEQPQHFQRNNNYRNNDHNRSQQTRRNRPWKFHAPNFDVNVPGQDDEPMDVEQNFLARASGNQPLNPQHTASNTTTSLTSGPMWDD